MQKLSEPRHCYELFTEPFRYESRVTLLYLTKHGVNIRDGKELFRMPLAKAPNAEADVLKKVIASNGSCIEHPPRLRRVLCPKYLMARDRMLFLLEDGQPQHTCLTT
jgi:hypothetical protein